MRQELIGNEEPEGAEQQSRQAEDDLRRVARHGRCILWHSDVVDHIGYIDQPIIIADERAAQQILPLELKEGQSYSEAWAENWHPDDEAIARKTALRAYREGKTSYQQEFRNRNKFGEYQWLYEDVFIQSTGPGRWHSVGVCTDITDKKRVELALIANEERLRELVTQDELTGLYNRRELNRLLIEEHQRYESNGRPFSLIMIDVDHYKRVNDTFGHLAGDEVLRRVGAILLGANRPLDRAARFGGDEFVILLPECAKRDACEVAERLRKAVESEAFECRTVGNQEERLRITVSVGVASCPSDSASADGLLEAVDRALYRAKAAGRNQVSLASSEGIHEVERS